MRQRCSTAAAMMVVLLPAFALAQESLKAPAEETDSIVPTRDGYKAKGARRQAHERAHAGWERDEPLLKRHRTIVIHQNIAWGDQTPAERIAEWRCKADAVVIATVVSQRPVLSRQEHFIFTDYRMEVNESVKGPLSVGERFVLTRIGGEIVLPDEKLSYTVEQEQALVVGSKYLLFLMQLPEGDWKAVSVVTYEVKPRGGLHPMIEGWNPIRGEAAIAAMATARQAECR